MSLKDKFAVYKEHDLKCQELKDQLDAALKEKSEAVKAIASEIAPKKKVIYGGKELTVVVRGSTYFFKGEGKIDDSVVVVD